MPQDSTVTTSDPPAPLASSLVLVLSLPGARAIETRALPERGAVTIGRGDDCTLVIDDASLSRRHATLEVPALTLTDHGSRNGTWVGDVRLAPDATERLAIGRPFRLGQVGAAVVRLGAIDRAVLGEIDDKRAPALDAVHALAERVARSAVNVLIQGETGAGKEVLAERIHRSSPRADAPLVKINCAAMSPSLFESQMFGHERGAFTGASEPHVGVIEAADGGTLFLDEIAELPLQLQAKLLRVIEDRVVVRVGAVTGRRVDVRFVAASNELLPSRVDAGAFRADLYFRLATVTLYVPPLRERKEEIGPLAELFAQRAAEALHRAPPAFAADAMLVLRDHAWPGNVRQLRNVVERAVILCDGPTIGAGHLQIDEAPPAAPAARDDVALDPDKPEHLVAALARCAGNQTRAARLLGISRNTLLARLDQFGLPRPRKKDT